MSHSSHKRQARDRSLPLRYRASHVRSCVNHVANRLGTTRSQLIAYVLYETGIDLDNPKNEDDLMRAFEFFEALQPIPQDKNTKLKNNSKKAGFIVKQLSKHTPITITILAPMILLIMVLLYALLNQG